MLHIYGDGVLLLDHRWMDFVYLEFLIRALHSRKVAISSNISILTNIYFPIHLYIVYFNNNM
jgi:hypothetical protein